MIKLYDSSLYDFLPPNLKTAETEALMYAVDNQIKKLLDRAKRLEIWCNIDNVEEQYLDYIAMETRTLFYNSSLPANTKRKLIANSIYWYMKLGTSQAMQEMISIVFNNSYTSVEEWYTYSGEAYHFRIATDSSVTTISMTEFLKYLNTVKNIRSKFDYLILQDGVTIKIKNTDDVFKFDYMPCGEINCGTFPDISYSAEYDEVNISINESDTSISFDYDTDNDAYTSQD